MKTHGIISRLRNDSFRTLSTHRGHRDPFLVYRGGTSIKPRVIDGQGDIIDGGVYLTESDWTDNEDGTWSTATNSFLPIGIRHASWYKYSTKRIMNAEKTKSILQPDSAMTGIDTDDDVCIPFVYYNPGTLVNQGDAKWVSATNNVTMKSINNPCTLYGEIVIPNYDVAALVTTSHVRLKNFKCINFYKNAIRCVGDSGLFSNIEVSNCLVAYSGGGWNTSNTIRAGNGITFKPNNADNMEDIRATGNYVTQCFDACIDTQLDSTSKVQTGDNFEFDNNLVEKGSVGLFHGCMLDSQNHSITNALIHDNEVKDMGYGWGTYQRASDCQYGGYNRGNAITFLTQKVGQSVSGQAYNNTCDHYSGFKSDDSANTLSGISTYGAVGVSLSVNTNNTFTNDTGDFESWDVLKTCFNPFYDGFPTFN